MKRRALVITDSPDFGDQIAQAFELDGRFSVRTFNNLRSAVEDARQNSFDLVVLDANVAVQSLEQASRALRWVCPESLLVFVPSENWVSSALVTRIAPEGMLTRPLSLSDLGDLLDDFERRFFITSSQPGHSPLPSAQSPDEFTSPERWRAFSQDTVHPPAETPPASPFTPEPAGQKAGSGLVVLRQGSSRPGGASSPAWLYDVSRAAQYLARLSMETSAQAALILRGGQIWAFAGQVTQADALELGQVIAGQWGPSERTPGKPREQQTSDRRDLIRFISLSNQQEFILYATSLVDDLVLALAFDAQMPFRMVRSQAAHLAHALSQPPEGSQQGVEVQKPSPQTGLSPEPRPASREIAPLPPSSSTLFTDVPPSAPGNRPRAAFPPDQPPAPPPSAFSVPSGLPISPAILYTGRPDLDDQDRLDFLHPSFAQKPVSTSAGQEALGLETVTPALSRLLYTCVIVPRLPTHLLTGDLASRLAQWLPQLCIAYGWRLEKFEPSSEYLAWVVRVQLETSPSQLMSVLRQQTSLRIFADFPALARENPSGDFWAPGYLILSTGSLPSQDVIRSFIQQTRFYQAGTGPLILKTPR